MKHEWKSQQQGGDPADAGSAEWVTYCDACGVEDDGENTDGDCEPAGDDAAVVVPILPPYQS